MTEFLGKSFPRISGFFVFDVFGDVKRLLALSGATVANLKPGACMEMLCSIFEE